MPRNGSGTMTLPAGNPVVPGTVITSTWANTTLNDVASAITQSIAYDGQTVPIADLPLGNFKLTNVGNANQRNQYAAYGQVQDGQPQWMTVSGTDTILGTIAPSPTGYVAGQQFRFVAAGANTTSTVTLNINSLGAKNVTKSGTNALAPGDIPSGAVIVITYDGTQFQILSVRGGTTPGITSFKNLQGLNNTATPNTKYDVLADALTLRNPTTGEIIVRTSTGTLTNDIGVVGPAANGRDQAGDFTAASWIYLYFIWNGTTLATLTSASASAPVLPTGYTHSALATALRLDGSGNIVRMYTNGSRAEYDIAVGGIIRVLTNGTSTAFSTVGLSVFVPPFARVVSLSFYQNLTSTAAGQEYFSRTRPTGALSNGRIATTIVTAVSGQGTTAVNVFDMTCGPSQQIDYQVTPNTFSSGGLSIDVLGFIIPNNA